MPSFFSLRSPCTPGVFIGTMIRLLLRCTGPSDVLASTHSWALLQLDPPPIRRTRWRVLHRSAGGTLISQLPQDLCPLRLAPLHLVLTNGTLCDERHETRRA